MLNILSRIFSIINFTLETFAMLKLAKLIEIYKYKLILK